MVERPLPFPPPSPRIPMPSRQPPFPAPPSPPPRPEAHRHRHFVAAGAAAGAFVAVALALAALLWWWLRRLRRKRNRAARDDGAALQRVSYRRLRRATGGFAAANKVGQGGFGPVFRGALPVKKKGGGGGARPVAVKVMDAAGSLQGEREFHNEVAVASHILSSSSASFSDSPILLPFACSVSERPRRMVLVYDLMPNGSLQDALLGRKRADLVAEWPRRLAVARDVAAALHYLHSVVRPPVVHGDVKPSNVLLNADMRARLADFGLAHVNSDNPERPESGVIPQQGQAIAEGEDQDHVPDGGLCDDDVSVVAESTVTTTVNGEGDVAPNKSSPEDEDGFTSASPAEAASTSGFDRASVDSRSCNGASRTNGAAAGAAASGTATDWWWRQDTGAASTGGVKDYVMDWIRSEIKKERPKNNDWIAPTNSVPTEKRKKQKRRAREWWREDYVDELAKKQKRRALAKSKSEQAGLQWWEKDLEDDLDEKGPSKWNLVKTWSRKSSISTSNNGNTNINWWMNGARSSRDWASGEFVPKSGATVSSTPSMRGTVCYVAPEYGGGGPLSEKCDIYSYGVLLLVLISGRRPLQVTASPMSEYEKASLISWAKHLARASRLLDLVDPSLRDVNRDEALLCITVALLCIQRSPARRPSSQEVLGMLSCEGQLPQLPSEFSPSPPGGFPFKSRKKVR